MDTILLISSSGGHFSELMKIKIKNHETIIVTEKNEDTKDASNIDYFIKYGSRSNLFKYLFIFIYNFFKAFKIIIKTKPKIIISTGAHSAIPFFIIGKLLKKKQFILKVLQKLIPRLLRIK